MFTSSKNSTFFLAFIFVQILIFISPVLCKGSLIEEISSDFRPIEAIIISKNNGNYILNVGKNLGINPGDIFSLISKDEPLFQKKTKKIIGYKQRIVSKCQVKEVFDQKSICHPYIKVLAPPIEALRFNGLKASLFKDDKLISPTLPGLPLKRLIPHLKWLEPSSNPSPIISKRSMDAFGLDLIFQLKDNKLIVFGPGLIPIKTYSYNLTEIASFKQNQYQSALDKSSIHDTTQLKPIFDFSKAKVIGSLDDNVIQMDIVDLDNDGKEEVIYLLSDKFMIAPFKRKGQFFTYHTSDFEEYCSFSLSPESNFLTLNSIIDSAGLNSKLFSFKKDRLTLIQDEINLWLNFIETNCNSKKLTLLGQSFERKRLRGETIYKIIPSSDGIIYDESVHYPNDFSIQSVQPVILPDNICGIYYLSFDGFLKCYANSTRLWTSLQPFVTQNGKCGPKNVDLLLINGYLIASSSFKDKTSEKGAIFLIYPQKSLDLIRIDLNLNGTISGIVQTDNYIIVCVVTKEKKGYKSSLYQFDKEEIVKKLEEK